MLSRSLARLAGSVVLAALGAVVTGCESEQQNGQECLKNDDCASKRCIAYVCVESIADGGIDTGTAPTDSGAESATDAADSTTDTGTAPTDTGTAPTDTGTAPTDTGKADTDAATDAADGG